MSQQPHRPRSCFQGPLEHAAVFNEIAENVGNRDVAVFQFHLPFDDIFRAEVPPPSEIDIGEAHDSHVKGVRSDRFDKVGETEIIEDDTTDQIRRLLTLLTRFNGVFERELIDPDSERVEFTADLEDSPVDRRNRR